VRSTAGSKPQVSSRAMRQAQIEMGKSPRFFGRWKRNAAVAPPVVTSHPETPLASIDDAPSFTDSQAS
jgi:hypothetical protein